MNRLRSKILVVEDEPLEADFLKEALDRMNLCVELAADGNEAFEKIKANTYDIVLTDIKMPGLSGMEVLKATKQHQPDSAVVLMTAFGTVNNAVEAMKIGASDYICKPFTLEELELVIQKVLQHKKLLLENRILKVELASKFGYHNLVGKTPQMQKIFEQIDIVSQSKSTVLIDGETGTGKELVARAVHLAGSRREGPFIKINCAALPEGLVESELFGHEKGAFTGAIRKSIGRFELADGGTLLLDEISEITPSLQGKILRVLQEKEFEPVGSEMTVQVDVRIIATTNKNLQEETQKGRFREDLFYRLNVIPIHIPPLRNRKDDIPLLSEHFLHKYNQENNKNVESISAEVFDLFYRYHWPGNVRELENYMERGVVTTKKKSLSVEDFPDELRYASENADFSAMKSGFSLNQAEKALILKTLEECVGNRTKAAELLGITTRTLRNKLRLYSIK